jgi:FtsH-binding integral membrane protein
MPYPNFRKLVKTTSDIFDKDYTSNDDYSSFASDDHFLNKPDYVFKQQNSLYTEYIVRTVQTLFCQLVFTFVCISMVAMSKLVREFVITNSKQMITIGALGSLATIVWISASSYKSRAQLSLFTIFETITICTLCAHYSQNVLLTALLVTFGIVLSLIVYAVTTRNNYTIYAGTLYSSVACLIVTTICNIFLGSTLVETIILYIGTLLFFGYIVCDIQYFFSKKAFANVHTMTDAENVHIDAALNVYLDIINIFIRVLKCVSKLKDE